MRLDNFFLPEQSRSKCFSATVEFSSVDANLHDKHLCEDYLKQFQYVLKMFVFSVYACLVVLNLAVMSEVGGLYIKFV